MTMSVSSAMTDRKLPAKVSCGIVTQWSHDGQETAGEGFPVGLLRNGPMTNGKLLAKVSCGIVTQWSHNGRETVCEGFPTDMLRIGPLPDRKLSAKGFPLACHAAAP